MIQAFEFDELHHRVPDQITIKEWLEVATQRRNRRDIGIDRRFEEERDRMACHPCPFAGADHAMLGRLDAAAGPTFQQLTEIDDQAVVAGRHIDPFAATAKRLQARDTMLAQQGNKT